jgi:hypothetical protein
MINALEFDSVGPAPHLGPIVFSKRLNLLTGDNGLGKTFVLDATWWALTGTWPGRPLWPQETSSPQKPARLRFTVMGKGTESSFDSEYDYGAQHWPLPRGRPVNPGLVLYFRVDGQFSLWDPMQHYWRRNRALGVDTPDRPDALNFAPHEVWDTVRSTDGKVICRGLIEDWVSWQQTNSPVFTHLLRVVQGLAPVSLEPAPPRQVWLDDTRKHPCLALSTGEVPLTLASAGLKRMLAVAYLLVWAWEGHKAAAALLRQEPERRVTVLFDEPETHLHPQWQRRLLPALLDAVRGLDTNVSPQLLVSTHSPLILASAETLFDESSDRLLHFEPDEQGHARVEPITWAKRGTVTAWLTSPVFGLKQSRSLEGEVAIEAAEQFMRGLAAKNPPDLQTLEQLDARLREVLAGSDVFWPRWVARAKP